jgi:hypothetical protein
VKVDSLKKCERRTKGGVKVKIEKKSDAARVCFDFLFFI